MRPHLRRPALVLASLSALALGGLSATPALAATPATTLQLHVVNADGDSLANVEVFASGNGRSGKFVDFGGTDDDGNLLLTSGGHYGGSRLAPGRYDLEFDDIDRARFKADTSYASLRRQDVQITTGANDLGDITLAAGGVVTGTARTPSGLPLRGLQYGVDSSSTDEDFGFGFGDETTFENGSYELTALPVGHYDVSYDTGRDDDYRPATSYDIEQPGQHVTADFTARVASLPSATTLVATSPSTGQVQLVFKIANPDFGITDPHGVVTVASAAGKSVGEPVTVTSVNGTGKAVVTFAASSTSHVYKVHYGNGEGAGGTADLLSTSKSVKVSVK